jgi:hypothetical protein
VPASNTWTCLKTRSENSGAKGARTRIIVVGRVRIDHLSLSGWVTSVPYFFRSQMAKVELVDPQREPQYFAAHNVVIHLDHCDRLSRSFRYNYKKVQRSPSSR